ncbi:MAG: hypothetical protein RL757_2327 [Bacteroidota bacterium]|jgi:peptidoglycan/xylan/chitin deacetylase (PgdA/CDA1 family)
MRLPIYFAASMLSLASLSGVLSCQNQGNATNNNNTSAQKTSATPATETVAEPVFMPAGKMPQTKIDSNSKVVYLTFDDGPLMGSEDLNKIITEKQAKSSVFVVGKHALSGGNSKKIFNNFVANPYLEVYNHSHSHANNKYKNFYAREGGAFAARDIMQCEQELGLTTKIVRLPGRDIWVLPTRNRGLKQSGGGTAQILGQNGYKLFGWDMEWRRKGDNSPLESAETMIAQIDAAFNNGSMWTKNHLVILAHDPMFMKAGGQQELRQLIDYIKKHGYVLEHMRHYPNTRVSG